MRKKLLVELLIVLLFAGLGVYSTFFKDVNLGLDLKGGVYVVLEAQKEADSNGKVTPITADDMDKLVEVLDRRINALGTTEPRVQVSGTNRVIIEIPGVENTEEAVNMIGKTALLEFKLMEDDGSLTETGLTGKSLKNSSVTYDQLGRPQIAFELNTDGAKLFAEITKNNIGRQLAITLDGEVQSAPTIQSAIPGGTGTISGNYSLEEAKSFSTLLNAGALPLTAEILETRSVGATLGADSITESFNAGKVAVALIVIFMIIMYRMPGVIASIALLNFGILSFGILNYFDAVLTLPGIAGLILSLGMAVDANVIIFERIKEEIRAGQSIIKAVNSGFAKAFSAIMDSNITTLIMTSILYSLGTGPVRGFAVTLTIGTLASMFTAIIVTRLLLKGAVVFLGNISTKSFGVKGE
jgi:preprotein translocase subunit SecD